MSPFRVLFLTLSLALVVGGAVTTVMDFGPWHHLRRHFPDEGYRHLDWIGLLLGVLLLVGTSVFWPHVLLPGLTGYAILLGWHLVRRRRSRRLSDRLD